MTQTNDAESEPTAASAPAAGKRPTPLWQKLLPWVITVVCFAYLYNRIGAQTPEGQSVPGYLAEVFSSVNWVAWLALMIPYSFIYLLIDTAVLWRVINWFNTKVEYRHLLPVRASTYIISILNEQVGKGAMAVYLNRRDGVPGWQVGSSMLFIMFCEFFYLLSWAVIGIAISWNVVPPLFHGILYIALGAAIFWCGFVYFFRSERFAGSKLRERDILKAFREGRPRYYLIVMLIRSPAIVGAMVVYQVAAGLFGVEISFLMMMGILPVIFFGTLVPGPFRAVAVTLWPTLFPEHVAAMTVFGFVQHNFFLLFNAAIGLLFLRQANRELFDGIDAPEAAKS